ncbi:MAG: hypothetical protein R6U67_02635 [Sodalinema sp.]|uniref:hypothetical protein n=1 Tax=Sodalinema sp. TaxID=3080550 RepID=UPI0011F8B433|nr:MAG: hypothetical protein EYR95_00855 [Phormidium sp. SL48-SHIP]
MANPSAANWIWKIWAAIFLVSGAIVGGTLLLLPELVRQRTSLAEEVETINNLLSLKSSLDDLNRAERRAENPSQNPDEELTVAETPLLNSSRVQQLPEVQAMESADNEALEERLELELEFQQQVQAQIRQLQEEIAQLETNNRRLVQENNSLRGYQINYQQQIERKIELLQPRLAKIRQLPSVDNTFSLENVTLASLGNTVDFENLESNLENKVEQRNILRDQIRFLERSFSFGIILGLANLLIGGIYYWLDRWNEEQAQKIKETEEKIEEAQSKIRNFSWNMANASLEKYYQRNLMEVQVIFMTSVVVMILGFLLILASLAITLYDLNPAESPNRSPDTEVAERGEVEPSQESATATSVVNPNSDVATIGVIAGILTNFIGATFMIVYRSTVREASRYSNSLNRINDVGIAMDILNTAVEHEDTPEILMAKVEIAKRLVDSDRHPNLD